jgi:flavin reductase (DIM6/NTAB) family NADH-FMN oxidoreductase RutF
LSVSLGKPAIHFPKVSLATTKICVSGLDKAKDSLRNLLDTRECTINIISEHYIEAANATSVNAPHGVSEWALTGLTPADCKDVKCSRVKEAVFSVEGRLMSTQEFESKATPGKKTGVLAIIEGVRFWAREDAINDDRNLIDPAVSSIFLRSYPCMVKVDGCAPANLCIIDPPTHEQIGRHHVWPLAGRCGDSETGLG